MSGDVLRLQRSTFFKHWRISTACTFTILFTMHVQHAFFRGVVINTADIGKFGFVEQPKNRTWASHTLVIKSLCQVMLGLQAAEVLPVFLSTLGKWITWFYMKLQNGQWQNGQTHELRRLTSCCDVSAAIFPPWIALQGIARSTSTEAPLERSKRIKQDI